MFTMPIRKNYQQYIRSILIFCSFFIFTGNMCSFAQETHDQTTLASDITEISIEDLMNIEVTTVSKRAEKLYETAAAIYVITNEDIRRSGLTSIPEILRLAPGVQVARIDGNKWAISTRGFIDRFSNKLLVLMDGRSVYTPLFSGVWWDSQDTLIEDIERIEIIRGPGATMWGANAVNGIINIITKEASSTSGGLVTAISGTAEDNVGVRYGVKTGGSGYARFYTKYRSINSLAVKTIGAPGDYWHQARTGFRYDGDLSDKDKLTISGDIYDGNGKEPKTDANFMAIPFGYLTKFSASGSNILARWNRTYSDDSDLTLQIYFDHTKRLDGVHRETRNTWDFDFQQTFVAGKKHKLIWGLGYRKTSDDLSNSPDYKFNPEKRTDDLFSAFIQDEITLKPDKTKLTLGSKFERNDYTGYEIQPSIRLLYTPNTNRTLWAAISRAVRTPSRVESDVEIDMFISPYPGIGAVVSQIIGNPDMDSEDLLAYEVGYRIRDSYKWWLDIAAFYNDYNNLRTNEFKGVTVDMSTVPPRYVAPFVMDNMMNGRSMGIELVGNWQVNNRWQIQGSYTYLGMEYFDKPGSQDLAFLDSFVERNGARNQYQIRSYYDLGSNTEFDIILQHVDGLPKRGVGNYTRLDARLGWLLDNGMEISLCGQNLLDSKHFEFSRSIKEWPSEVERSIYGKLTWQF